jgi:hypothetical protein
MASSLSVMSLVEVPDDLDARELLYLLVGAVSVHRLRLLTELSELIGSLGNSFLPTIEYEASITGAHDLVSDNVTRPDVMDAYFATFAAAEIADAVAEDFLSSQWGIDENVYRRLQKFDDDASFNGTAVTNADFLACVDEVNKVTRRLTSLRLLVPDPDGSYPFEKSMEANLQIARGEFTFDTNGEVVLDEP